MEDVIEIFTDGACLGNPGPGGIGVVLEYKGHIRVYSEHIPEATNNIAELTAILRGLQLIKNREIPVVVYTDSRYALGVTTGAYRAKKNTELVYAIRDLMSRFKKVDVVKVRGHRGVLKNEIADRLATAAARGGVVDKRMKTDELRRYLASFK